MTVRIEGLDRVIRKLDKLEANLFKPMTKATAHIQEKMADYPPASGKPQPFKTDRQRRYFFWALREGLITIPYRRTGTLGRKWTHRVERGGRRGVVGNNTAYGPLVQSGDQQAGYHRGTWQTDQEVADREAGQVRQFFVDEIRKYT